MIVLFRNIPKDSYYDEFAAMVEPIIKGGLFQKKGTLKSLEIIALQEENTVSLEFQALANIEPQEAAQRVIKKMHGLYLRGHRLLVREYFLRNWRNDKRSQENANTTWPFPEKRTNSCRRRNLKVFKVAVPEYL